MIEPLNIRIKISTNKDHGIRLNRSYVRSTRPKGPHQSIHDGKTDCVVNLIERSSATSDSVYDRPDFEGIKLESNGAMGFANEEYPDIKGDALLKLLPDLEVK